MKKNNPNIEHLHSKTKLVSLSSQEKFDMSQNIRAYMDAKLMQPSIFRSPVFRHVFAYSILGAVLVTSGATSIAAEDALPGDKLYGVKTHVNETIIRTLAFTHETKAQAEIDLIDRRMEELGRMAVQERGTPEKVEMVISKINKHKADFESHVSVITKQEPSQKAIEMKEELEAVIETHLEILEKIAIEAEEKKTPKPDPVIDINPSLPDDIDIEIQLPPAIEEDGETLKASVLITKDGDKKTEEEYEITIDVSDLDKQRIEAALNTLRTVPVQQDSTQPVYGSKTRLEIRQRILEKAEKELGIELELE